MGTNAPGRRTPQGRQRSSQRRKGKKRQQALAHGKDPSQITEEAFVQARRRMPLAFWTGLLFILSQQFIANTVTG